jgi:hypothetical protein
VNRRQVLLCAALLLVVNLIIVAKLFGVEYSAYNGSVEGTFIALSRIMAKYPGEWQWWPYWANGMPFETAYLPFSHWVVAAFILVTRIGAARAFHMVTAAIYAMSAVSLFWMALAMSRKLTASFIAALAYSCFSFSNLLVPEIRADSGGLFTLRRLRVMVFWGESPHTLALALLPVAVVCFSYAVTTRAMKWKVLSGVMAAAVVLSNAFGIVALGTALICWLLAFPARPWWKAPAVVAAIGLLSYCWISPWLSPAMIRAIRNSAPTEGGDFRYRAASWIALAGMTAGFLLLWWAFRRLRAPGYVAFFVLFGYIHGAIMAIWFIWRVAVVPQPSRYQIEMDLAMVPAVVFTIAWLLERTPVVVRRVAAAVSIAGLAANCGYAAWYARDLIRAADPAHLPEYQMAQWLNRNRPGEMAFVSGSASLLYNAITDNPQLKGNHNQHAVNPFPNIAAYTIYSGMNAGDRDADFSIFWLKAYGARSITVSGPDSDDYYKPFAHPKKFEGILPVLWRDGDNTIYDVPGGGSLAHVIPSAAVVSRTPLHGLDTAPVESYVAALEDSRYPPATFRWKSMTEAAIHSTLAPGQTLAVQVTYDRGWEARSHGKRQRIRRDGLGLMVIDADCAGDCDISLRFTGGWERWLTRGLSCAASLIALGLLAADRRRRIIYPNG